MENIEKFASQVKGSFKFISLYYKGNAAGYMYESPNASEGILQGTYMVKLGQKWKRRSNYEVNN